MKNSDKVTTTIKLKSSLYDDLKILSIKNKFSLQTFAEKCVYLYVFDDGFRNKINEFVMPVLSSTGSL
jgi:hypothetical protein